MATKKGITDAQVMSIRKKASKGATYVALAEEYGCDRSHIASIARGVSFKSVGGPITNRHPRKVVATPKPRATKKRATAMNGRPPPDLAALSIDEASRLLQALTMEWPKLRLSFLAAIAAFQVIDDIIRGQTNEK